MTERPPEFIVVVSFGSIRIAALRTAHEDEARQEAAARRRRGEQVSVMRARSEDDYEVIEDDEG